MMRHVGNPTVHLATEPVDMRKSINGLSVLVADHLECNPLSDSLFVFYNTATGALASRVIYSLLQSARANGLPVMAWLTFVLEELPRCTNDEQRRALLPHRFDIRRLNKNASDD